MNCSKYLFENQKSIYLKKFSQGIQLFEEDQAADHLSLSELLHSPFCVYLVNQDSQYQIVNEASAGYSSYDSAEAAVGRTIADFTKPAAAQAILSNNQNVMTSAQTFVLNEHLDRIDERLYTTLTIKLPWFNEHKKINGLLGCSIIIGEQPLAESLAVMMRIGLLNAPTPEISAFKKLSPQQRQCAQYLIAGDTSKAIARKTGLSPRTVEAYIYALKKKYACQSKAQLIILLNKLLNDL